jgi:hypothetical protein
MKKQAYVDKKPIATTKTSAQAIEDKAALEKAKKPANLLVTDKGIFKQKFRLPKRMRKSTNILKFIKDKDIVGHVFNLLQARKHCVVCGKVLKYNNSRQIVRYCSRRCHWARHNHKYLKTQRGHK